ncbi:MAG TPA: DEAD/DEAH box helicase [Lachnospiraceae bacterium]|nr:DEAD/DEAH box helicase [Lachnospiraceae bacterium]
MPQLLSSYKETKLQSSRMEISLPSFFTESTREWFAESLGEPTLVQTEAWPHIHEGENILASAPTGTGKTLTAFLVFLDELIAQSVKGTLQEGLQIIYISPLKSLAADIRENLKRPLEGIYHKEMEKNPKLVQRVRVAIRTGDTTQSERREMIKKPPHILITTPESLFLLLTSMSGRVMLSTARVMIVDELHAMIDTKRGAHLILSLARLDELCGNPLQRIGLSATIEPLSVAAEYLSPDPVSIIAPAVKKKVEIQVSSPQKDESLITKDSVWRDIAARIFDECQKSRSVITFVEGRKPAEQLAMYMRELGGEDFARVHHGSLSKEQRSIVEQDLKQGRIRLLIATSSMELGIDVGEIEQVFQVGLPRTISSTMQRLGRAGHSPSKTSVMQIFPRTAQEALYCGMTAEVARNGGIEHSKPPRMCLDVLAQHLVSMAANKDYEVREVMPVLKRAKPFCDIQIEDVRSVLRMLAGDYEHEDNVPVRPRLLYDRIHDKVEGDAYSRMLAIMAGGTIPDRGMFIVKTENGVKVGEVEEEFVFECRVGDEFQLGSFHWRIQQITKDTMYVIPSVSKRDRLPFWKGDITGRKLMTGISFGEILRNLEQAYYQDANNQLTDGNPTQNNLTEYYPLLNNELTKLGLDVESAQESLEYIDRQITATEVLPSDKTMILEHYQDEDGNYQLMVHSVFGNCINAPLALLLQDCVAEETKATINYVSDDDGIVLFSYDGLRLPNDLLYHLKSEMVEKLLDAMVMATPTFNIMFRYNAGRALMMGMSRKKRQPLWLQRAKGAQMLERAMQHEGHPLIRETKRECLEDFWDMEGLIQVLQGIKDGSIQVRELFLEVPSPMSFLLRKKTEESLMYNYAPMPNGVISTTEMKLLEVKGLLNPDTYQLEKVQERKSLPEDEKQLHTLLMIEGDLIAGELPISVNWLEKLLQNEQVLYIEPGLWIAAEQNELYEMALLQKEEDARAKIVLRLIRYRGGQSLEEVAQRYGWSEEETQSILDGFVEKEQLVYHEETYFHKELYDRARTATIKSRRELVKTQEFPGFASYMLNSMSIVATPSEQLEYAVEQLCGQYFAIELWETVILPARVTGYRPEALDTLLSQGNYYWKLNGEKELCFLRYEDVDWDWEWNTGLDDKQNAGLDENTELTDREKSVCTMLKKRGACFANALAQAVQGDSVYPDLVNLAQKGLVCTDSFGPVRYLINRASIEKAVARQQVQARMKYLSAGRWDFSRCEKPASMEVQVERALRSRGILCRETAKGIISWQNALEVLRIWEYVNKVRRGYFVKGLSGIQFILEQDYKRMVAELPHPKSECRWICAIDPAQTWGKLVPHMEGRSFINVLGTYVGLYEGRVIAVFEHKGKILRVFEEELLDESMKQFTKEFSRKNIYAGTKRIVVKEYPQCAEGVLKKYGFKKEIMDYVLYL